VLGGHVDLTTAVPGSVMPHLKSGAMIPLVITGKQPYHLLPNVPTFASVGLESVNPGAFRFMAAPAGVPAALEKKLIATIRAVMEPQDFRTRLIDNGFDPELLTDAEARAYIVQEMRKWRQAVKDAGA
jgi:tripartite-type tricarboxylate transporter receptor subunit TctC